MTRETKAGLVVSASFLFLVGVVLAMKLKGMDGAAPAEAKQDQELLDLASAIEAPKPVEGEAPAAPVAPEKFNGDIRLASVPPGATAAI